MSSDDSETWGDILDAIECPWCHEKMNLSDMHELYTEDGVKIDCYECDKPLEIYGSCDWSWTVHKDDN